MPPRPDSGPPVFHTTRWSVVETAGAGEDTAAAAALETLCTTYWTPVYAYARCRGHAPADALDLAQGFFERVIAGGYLAQADRTRGRFRSFLLTALQHYLANQRARARAARRGGGVRFVPLDAATAETRCRWEPADPASPDRAFDRQWAMALLEAVMADLRLQYHGRGEARLLAALQPCLATGRDRLSYAALGAELGLSEGAVKVAVHRMRRRYRDLLRQRVADTVRDPAGVEAELRDLFRILAGP